VSRRKAFEELAHTRTKRRIAVIRKQIELIGYDWYDSEIHVLSSEADTLRDALDNFVDELHVNFAYWKEDRE
jgi:hypothetical protein